jgi:hypothetical protein
MNETLKILATRKSAFTENAKYHSNDIWYRNFYATWAQCYKTFLSVNYGFS